MRRQAPTISMYGETNPRANYPNDYIPRAGDMPPVGGYAQFSGGVPNVRISNARPPIILVNEHGRPIRLDCCIDGCSLLNILKIVMAEALGTLILMYVGCSGFLLSPITFGVAIMAATQIFADISGAHINPAVTFASLIMGRVSLMMVPFYLFAQCIGAIVGYGLHYTINEINDIELGQLTCLVSPAMPGFSDNGILFGMEFILSAIYIMAICSLWDRAGQSTSDIAGPLKRGLLYSILVACAYGKVSLNPFRASIPYIWGVPKFFSVDQLIVDHWIYWLGPFVGALFASSLYRTLAGIHKKLESNNQ